MTAELTITAKGQVTLKKSVLEHLGLKPGDKVAVSLQQDGRVELTPTRPKRTIADLAGILYRPGEPVPTIEEINEAIAQGAVDSYLRSR